jgi:hypothetical protein
MNILNDINNLIEEMFVLPPVKKSPNDAGGIPPLKKPIATNPQSSQARQPMMKQGMQRSAIKAPTAPTAPRSN